MTIHFNLHRFGVDEFAVGHLINGDFPEDDNERWRIVDAPRYHIQRLLDEHLRAQAALSDCRDSSKPFVLFLRSFSSEHHTQRIDQAVVSNISLHSIEFQQWLNRCISQKGVPFVKLHGGSDGLVPDLGNDLQDAKILSTHSGNWQAVAQELIQAAPVIVFLVSHISEGVLEEFNLIQELGRMDRCLVVLLDASNTPESDTDGVKQLRARLGEFPHVFELQPGKTSDPTAYAEQLLPTLTELLRNAHTDARFEQTLAAEFTYLEPGFTDSEDFTKSRTQLWRGLRLLRVLFEDTYWAALKSHEISLQQFTFPGPWKMAHHLYGLAIATADFRAIREALSYLSILYVARGADFALLIRPLAAQFDELAAKIFAAGPPETESQYWPGPDPLTLPAKINAAIELFQFAETEGQSQGAETANYLYQAAVICALRSSDGDDLNRRWIIANMCRDWARYQGSSGYPEWAVTNCQFAVKLIRNLAEIDHDHYSDDLALFLNNLGSLYFKQRNLSAANEAFVEALEIRRTSTSESEKHLANLYSSLANVGLVRVDMGDFAVARKLYSEALIVCETLMTSKPETIVELTRLQGWMSLCLAQTPDARREGLEYAQRAASNLQKISQFSLESADALRELVDAALQANSEE